MKGSSKNSVLDLSWNGYGPGSQYTINTNEPIHVKVEIAESNGIASGIKTTFSQNGKAQVMSNTDSENIGQMTEALKSQVFVAIDFAGPDGYDSWLRGDRCSGACYKKPT